MSGWLCSLGISLGLTLLFEGAFALAWGLRGRDLTLCALVNLLTNPPLVFLVLCWRHFGPAPAWLPVPGSGWTTPAGLGPTVRTTGAAGFGAGAGAPWKA